MAIKIEITTADLRPLEAGALAALLMTLHPDAVTEALGSLDITGTHSDEPLLPFPTRCPLPEAAPHDERRWPAEADVAAARPDEPLTPEAAFGGAAPFVPVASATAPASAPAGTQAAPSPIMPIGSTATSNASPSDVDLDAEGLPWDGRIHSSNHKRSANGVWMKRRGLNQLVEHKVRAELRETYPEPETPAKRTLREAVADGLVSPPEAGAPLPPAAPPAPPPPPPSAAASAIPAPPPAPAPAASTGPAPTPSGADQFAEAMKVATAAQAQGVITAADTIAIAVGLGLTSLRDLVAPANAAFIPQFRAGLDAMIAERGAA